jgi:hypothetical protein
VTHQELDLGPGEFDRGIRSQLKLWYRSSMGTACSLAVKAIIPDSRLRLPM